MNIADGVLMVVIFSCVIIAPMFSASMYFTTTIIYGKVIC